MWQGERKLVVTMMPSVSATAALTSAPTRVANDTQTMSVPRLCFLLRTSLLPRRQFRLVRRSLCCARRSRQFLQGTTPVSVIRSCPWRMQHSTTKASRGSQRACAFLELTSCSQRGSETASTMSVRCSSPQPQRLTAAPRRRG